MIYSSKHNNLLSSEFRNERLARPILVPARLLVRRVGGPRVSVQILDLTFGQVLLHSELKSTPD